MSAYRIKYRARYLGAAMLTLFMSSAALADSVTSLRYFARPITPPTFDSSPDYDQTGEGLAPNRVSIAAGAALVSDYDGADHYGLAPMGAAEARLHGHTISWRGTSLGVDLVPEYRGQKFKWIFAPFIDVNLDRTGRANDPVVALLPRLGPAAEGGAVIGFSRTGVWVPNYDRLTVQIAASHDLGTVHHSFVISPSAGYVVPLSKAALVSASASMDIVGAGYARTYYGIDSANSALSGLPVYRPGGGIKSASIGMGGLVSLRGDLRKGFALGGLLRYERLFGDAAASPLVALRGNPNQFSAALGVAYTF